MPLDFLITAWDSLNRAAALILSQDPEKPVLIWGHDDPDGVTATAIITKSLSRIFRRVEYYIPPKSSLHYGLDEAVIARYVHQGFGLLITVDCGISNFIEVELAQAQGLTVIITDHHELPPKLPPANAILNPKMEEEGRPTPDLAGCGVALYLAAALDYESHSGSKFHDPESLAWVALGTVADRVPLRDENRSIVGEGMKNLSSLPWVPPAAAIMGLDLSLGFCPNILKETLVPLLASQQSDGTSHVSLNLLQNKISSDKITHLWQRAEDHRRELEVAEKNLFQRLDPGQNYLLIMEPGLRPGLIGALATRLRQATGKPSVVITQKGEYLVGECRGYLPLDFVELLRSLEDLFLQYGGHKQAAGFIVAPGFEDVILPRLEAELRKRGHLIKAPPIPEPDYHVPDLLRIKDLQNELKSRFPLGPGNPEPTVLIDYFCAPLDDLQISGRWMAWKDLIRHQASGRGSPARALLDITHEDNLLVKIIQQ